MHAWLMGLLPFIGKRPTASYYHVFDGKTNLGMHRVKLPRHVFVLLARRGIRERCSNGHLPLHFRLGVCKSRSLLTEASVPGGTGKQNSTKLSQT